MIEISVIIPYYQDLTSIKKCIKSLSEQTLSENNFEVIIVSNEPTLQAFDFLNDYKLKISLLHEPNGGSYAARNLGIKKAKGKHIAFLDSDCLPKEDFLDKGLKLIREHPVVAGKIELSPINNIWSKYDKTFYFGQQTYVSRDSYAVTANLFVQKDIFDKIGPFDAFLHSGGDKEWCSRLRDIKIHYSPEIVVRHPSRNSFLLILKRRIRICSSLVYLQLRSGSLSPQHESGRNLFYSKMNLADWICDMEFFESLTKSDQWKITRIHSLFMKIDKLIFFVGRKNYKLLKSMMLIDKKWRARQDSNL
ncbi:MAG: hypothetical protein Fur0010_00850 [Bdellovibrio sp.]